MTVLILSQLHNSDITLDKSNQKQSLPAALKGLSDLAYSKSKKQQFVQSRYNAKHQQTSQHNATSKQNSTAKSSTELPKSNTLSHYTTSPENL